MTAPQLLALVMGLAMAPMVFFTFTFKDWEPEEKYEEYGE